MADGDAFEPPFGLEFTRKLGDQPRLASTRLANEAHELRPATLHALKGGEQLIELIAASNHCGQQPVCSEPACGAGFLQPSHQTVHNHRLRLAAQRQLPRTTIEGEAMLGERVSGIGNQHAARGCGQQPGRGVHGIAGDSVSGGSRLAEIARHHWPRVDADMELDGLAELVSPVCAELDSASLHVECRSKRTLRVILVRHRRAEHRQDSITNELLHKPVVSCDGLGQCRK